ncbi:MAG: MarR family transcriptional regulator [Sphaerochaetaceae bacterium]|nr:MarR family transcriptional regulator [Sphaerochaetaceae bacterium]MDC7237401.1 MarR family transcriptional regulator [Sphaerochaetaceae bacterium]MDC7249063.1 MarR family transcriptional regulator [Sphaerochaetaceae bacterium]
MEKNEFSSFRELRENMNRMMSCFIKNVKTPISQQLNLNASQIQVILLLMKYKNQKMSDLTKHTNVVKSSMTNIIDSLEALQLVKRIRNKDDRRIVFVGLTDKGEDLANNLRKAIFHLFEQKLSYISTNERQEFIESINKITFLINKMENIDEK